LFKQAFELGATSTSDFTDKVTYLLANSHGGAKYLVRPCQGASPFVQPHSQYLQCALERKIPIMRPEWITDAYEVWLRGDDVNLAEVSHAESPIIHITPNIRRPFPNTASPSSLGLHFHSQALTTSTRAQVSTVPSLSMVGHTSKPLNVL
jgi:hypothetical protein